MVNFDLDTFLAVNGGTGEGVLGSVGAAFGMPTCMINLAKTAMQVLPASVLSNVNNTVKRSRQAADEVTKAVIKKIFLDSGIIEFDSEEGTLRFVSDASLYGLDSDKIQFLGDLGAFLEGTAAFGSKMYSNYQNIDAQLKDIGACFDKYERILQYEKGASAAIRKEKLTPEQLEAFLNAKYETERLQLIAARNFIEQCNRVITDIDSVFQERAEDPTKEPIFVSDEDVMRVLSGTTFRFDTSGAKLPKPSDVFRLVYGPPQSQKGRFLLSVDGLYYNSQDTSAIQKVLSYLETQASGVENSTRYQFEFDPNIGGKGVSVGKAEVKKWIGTLLDPDITDDSEIIKKYYIADQTLNVLDGSRAKLIFDLNTAITSAITEYGSDSAIVRNMRQSVISEEAKFQEKIKKRKKQIEIAVKIPSLFGKVTPFKPGEIPLNDFSHLRDFNIAIALSKQKKLVLDLDDVSSIILPVSAVKYTVSPLNFEEDNLEHLLIAQVDPYGILYYGTSAHANEGDYLPIVEKRIVTDGLIGMFNFLNTNAEDPAEPHFNCINSVNGEHAQLVGNPADIFVSGAGIPLLDGICKLNGFNNKISGVGQYVRLPDTENFRNFTYKERFSLDWWMYVPHLDSPSLGWGTGDDRPNKNFRLVMGCENTGGQVPLCSYGRTGHNDGLVRGALIGFTRDRRFTSGLDASTDLDQNHPFNSLAFVIAPTQSRGTSAVDFVTSGVGQCGTNPGYNGMVIDAYNTCSVSNYRFLDACRRFVHVVITVDTVDDQMNVYLDKELIATSSVADIFRPKYAGWEVPNFHQNGSFYYTKNNVNSDAPDDYKDGVKLNKFFTPWIVGGGWTDGMYFNNNFMGTQYGGRASGLGGHIGSLKIYEKALSSSEVTQNFNAQSDFFTNIATVDTCWEHIEDGP